MAESGRIVTNEKTGEKAWWDGQNLQPIRIAPGTNMEGMDKGVPLTVTDQSPPGNLPPPPGQPNPANPPRFPKIEQLAQTLAGPAATLGAGLLTGGWSIPAQMAVGAGTEALGEKLGGENLNPTKIGIAAALPPATRAVGAMIKPLARGAAKVFGGENLIQGGIQKTESILGKPAAEAASKSTLNAAKAVTTPVVQTETGKVVSRILKSRGRIAGIDSDALNTAEEIARNAYNASAAGKPINYGEVFDSATNMSKMATAAKGHDKGAFIDLRDAMLTDLRKLGPEADKAVAAYRYKSTINDITDALGKASPARKIGQLLEDPLVKGSLTKEQENVVQLIAKQIGNAGLLRIGSSLAGVGAITFANPVAGGAAIAAPAIMGALVATPKIGAVMARSLVGPEGKINSAAIPALAQMVRGYLAQQEGATQ